MVDAVVTGANGSLGAAIVAALLRRGLNVLAVTRNEWLPGIADPNLCVVVDPNSRYECFQERVGSAKLLFVCSGAFVPSRFIDLSHEQLNNQVEANLSAPMRAVQAFLYFTPDGCRRDVVVIGSTSAFAGYRNTVAYCAAKHALRGLVAALNDEYRETDTRFWLASMGTMANDMGSKVDGVDLGTCLNPADVANVIVSRVMDAGNHHEPEFTIRRRYA